MGWVDGHSVLRAREGLTSPEGISVLLRNIEENHMQRLHRYFVRRIHLLLTSTTYVWTFLSRPSFGDTRCEADEEVGEDTHAVKEATGISSCAGKGSYAHQSLTDSNGGEELCLQKLGLTDLDLQDTEESISQNENNYCNRDAVVMSDQTRRGLWGPDGLLAHSNVKIILLLVCVVQVRRYGIQDRQISNLVTWYDHIPSRAGLTSMSLSLGIDLLFS